MYCLDTNIVIDILRGDKKLGDKIERLLAEGFEIFLTPITLCELYRGAYGHVNYKKKILEVNSFILNFEILEFDAASCEEFGKTYKELEKKGKLIGEFDLMIASIVKSKRLVIVTRDKKDFENTGVRIEVW